MKVPSLSGFSSRLSHVVLAGALCLAGAAPAHAAEDGRLQASYSILLGGLTIGRFTLDAEFSHSSYEMTIRGTTSGVSRFVSDGRGFLKSDGRIAGARVLPGTYTLDTSENGQSTTVAMRMNAGSIVSLAAYPPLAKKADRIPVLTRHKHNILDPLSAMIVPLAKGHERAACNRRIPVFDGWQRFDVRLFYKGTAEVAGPEGSYAGPVVVCGARYVPVAGHRPSRDSVDYMAKNTDLEVWLAPVEGLGVMMPYRFRIGTEVGPLTVHASRFVGAAATRRASAD